MNHAGLTRGVTWVCQTVMLFGVLSLAFANQDPRNPDQTAPPPLKFISRSERTQLDGAKDPKSRLRTTLELAESHLVVAENKTTEKDYDAAASGVGRYWALIEDALAFLKTQKTDSNKTRDLYKRLELTLRAHGPRLTAIRRGTPNEYAVWIKEIEDFARKGRTEALNSFYGNTVVHDAPPGAKASPKNSMTPPPKP
jgi:hypothetical protein